MAYREFVSVIGLDEDMVSSYSETNGYNDAPPGEVLEREFGWLHESGIYLWDWAIVDEDVRWERYLRYLVKWAIDHNGSQYEGMSPACYAEWQGCENGGI